MENQKILRNEDFQLFDLWARNKRFWPWFVLSVFICCGAALLYVMIVPEAYERSASVIIKEDSNMTDISAAFSRNVNQFNLNTNINNEIEAFKSPHLMQEVIQRLNLTVSYSVVNKLKKDDLYTQTPVVALLPDAKDQDAFSFYVELLSDTTAVLSKFEQDDEEINQILRVTLNDTVSTPVGKVALAPSLLYPHGQYFMVPIKVIKSRIRDVNETFSKKLAVSLSGKESSVIVLDFEDVSAQRADDVLNTMISVYNETWISYKNTVAVNTSKFISERLPLIEQELGTIDDNLEQYKSKNLLTDTRSAASIYMKESSEYSSKVLDVTNQIAIATYIQEYLNDHNKTADLLPTNSGLNNTAIETQIGQYNTMLLKRNELTANSSEKNPLVADMDNSLKALRQSIVHTVNNLIVSLNVQLSSLRTQEAQTTRNIASNPGQEKHLLSIEREKEIKESLYLYLLQKREENDMSLAMTSTNTRMISPPSGSKKPVKPKMALVFLIAFTLGAGLPVSVIWGREMLNSTIRSKKDLIGLSAPLLGIIPKTGRHTKKTGPLLVQEKGRDLLNESFRMLRTNMEFMCSENTNVVLFSSFEPGAGKTFTALNLAMSFALAGKKIILLDMDMRTATLSRYISSPELGIANFLNKMITDEHWIIEKDYFYPGFDMLPVGIIPPNPAELLMSDQLKILIDRLKTMYDYVFIDGTPVDLVADATIVSKYADMTVFVVRENFTDRRKLAELENTYSDGKFRKLAVLLNDSRQDMPSGKYYHTYYYGKSKDLSMLTNHQANDIPYRKSKALPAGLKAAN